MLRQDEPKTFQSAMSRLDEAEGNAEMMVALAEIRKQIHEHQPDVDKIDFGDPDRLLRVMQEMTDLDNALLATRDRMTLASPIDDQVTQVHRSLQEIILWAEDRFEELWKDIVPHIR